MTVLFTLFLYLNNKFTLGVQLEPQGLDVPITEVLHFFLGSSDSCIFINLLREFQRAFPINGGEVLFKLCKQDGSLHMILSIKLDTLTARILKLSSDSHSRIVPAPLYSRRKPADR